MAKVAVLYVSLGKKYHVFWPEFYETFKKNFLNKSEVTYFVFSETRDLKYADQKDVHIVDQEDLGWPGNTLNRFDMFLKIEEELKDYDYTYFFNSNYLCTTKIKEEDFLPGDKNLVVTIHPRNYLKTPEQMPYDRNPESLACIPMGEGEKYVMGGLNGGKTANYLAMIKELKKNTDIDSSKGVVAKWHDESHLNRYIIGRDDIKFLPPAYGYPEGFDFPFEPVMLLREKNRYFDVDVFKAKGIGGKIMVFLGRIKSKVAIRIRIRKMKQFFISLFKKGK